MSIFVTEAIFRDLKLELPTQIPASNDEKYQKWRLAKLWKDIKKFRRNSKQYKIRLYNL